MTDAVLLVKQVGWSVTSRRLATHQRVLLPLHEGCYELPLHLYGLLQVPDHLGHLLLLSGACYTLVLVVPSPTT